MTQRWYLVYCKPRQETTARTNLERQRYSTYLPRIRQTRRRQGRRVTVIAPMFPRYLFIHLSEQTDNWGPIRSTLGVVSLVRFGMRPASIPKDLIELLRQRENEEGIQVLPVDQYRQGAKIRITEGGFAGYEGIFLARSGTRARHGAAQSAPPPFSRAFLPRARGPGERAARSRGDAAGDHRVHALTPRLARGRAASCP